VKRWRKVGRALRAWGRGDGLKEKGIGRGEKKKLKERVVETLSFYAGGQKGASKARKGEERSIVQEGGGGMPAERDKKEKRPPGGEDLRGNRTKCGKAKERGFFLFGRSGKKSVQEALVKPKNGRGF